MLSAIQQFFTDLWDSLTQTMSNPDMAAQLVQPISGLLQLLTPLLALFILIRCGRSLLRGKIEEEVWGYLVTADQTALSPPPTGKTSSAAPAGVMWCSTSPLSPAVTPP